MNRGIIRVALEAIALCGPGLPDWITSRPMLTGTTRYLSAPIRLDPPVQLSAAEQRRAIPSVKLALGVGAACMLQSGHDLASLPAVFASSGADGETIVAILSALAKPGREVSPTRFHNSVHNAPSGYWGIAAQSREAVTSVTAYDASFAAGLLEAGVQAVAGDRAVLLVAYDLPYPDPLDTVRRINTGFGVAFVVSPAPSDRPQVVLHLRVAAAGELSGCADQGLEGLRLSNPAARSLPLLALLAAGSAGNVRLQLASGVLDVAVMPC